MEKITNKKYMKLKQLDERYHTITRVEEFDESFKKQFAVNKEISLRVNEIKTNKIKTGTIMKFTKNENNELINFKVEKVEIEND